VPQSIILIESSSFNHLLQDSLFIKEHFSFTPNPLPIHSFILQPSRHVRRLNRSATSDMQGEKQKEYFDNLAKSKENYNLSSVDTTP
jgi:hypothetical protein